jgi:hypothetical protein
MNIRTRLTKLEHSAGALFLDQSRCPACGGQERIAFADEPDNFGLPLLYSGTGGVCVICRKPPPPGTYIMQLPAPVAEFFRSMPWAACPRQRFIEKLLLFVAIAQRDIPQVERLTKRICARAEEPEVLQ